MARQRIKKLNEVKRVAQSLKAHPRRVDFGANGSDFMVAMLFNIGMESMAIAELTGLTKGQVEYRVRQVEWELRLKAKNEGKKFLTARKQYRKGTSPVSRLIVSQITGRQSLVKKHVIGVLDKRGLMTPSK